MSNTAVGNVYQAIIDEVINSSRVDFEESGVEESVLEELRQVSLHLLIPIAGMERPGLERSWRAKPLECARIMFLSVSSYVWVLI